MVDILENGISGEAIQGALGSAYTLVYWVILLVIIAAVLYFVTDRMKYKVQLRVREITNGVTIVKDCAGWLGVDKHGIRFLKSYRFLKKPLDLPLPPENAISVTSKGKRVIEVWKLQSGEFSFVIDQGPDLKKFQSFTPNQRISLVNELKKADYNKGDWTQHIPLITSSVTLIIIFIIAISFWGDVVAPAQELQKTNLEIASQQKETVRILQEIIQNKQVIRNEEAPQ